ncbi:MAG: HEAT repeat domain-containing protein, partial [Proteobacteria bacterium]|nr:HEAT repeat domain-containing protein [Pseudomonadota bacterium]
REGGDIPYSISHNSGRDADIGFYYTDEKGKFFHPNHLYKINRSLQTRTEDGKLLTFDLEKNTTLVETLLTHPKINLQFIFLAKYIRTAVQKELVRRGASEDLLNRFEQVVQIQAAHNDHFHIRIYCSNEDICAGCIDKSLIHEWQEDPLPKHEKCVQKHLGTLNSKKSDSAHKAAALQRLALMGDAAEHSSKILKFLNDEDVTVRSAASLAAQSLDSNAAKALSDRLDKEDNDNVRKVIIQSLATFDSENSRNTFIKVLSDNTVFSHPQNLSVILKYISGHPHEAYLSTLMTLLGNSKQDEQTKEILLAIGTVANRDFCHKTTDLQQCRTKASEWFGKNSEKTRQNWLISGFNASGYKVKALDAANIPALLDAIDGPRPVSINAQLALKQIGHIEQNSLDWSVDDARWHYTRYFKRRAKKYKIKLDDRDEHGIKVKK